LKVMATPLSTCCPGPRTGAGRRSGTTRSSC
jgi:hypothetical protein